jgi:protein phosphatase
MRLEYAAASDVGLVRKENEDSFVVKPGLFAVCDGMGGAQAGEVASEEACRRLLELGVPATEEELRLAVEEANAHIYRAARLESGLAGMGTTLTAAVTCSDDGFLTIAHVGDSRAYRWHAGEFVQLTDDHSLVAEMVRAGRLTPEEAAVHPHRSVITRALGTEPVVQVDMMRTPVDVGDRLLICSDGLSGMVKADEIARIVAGGDNAADIARALVTAALAGGGEDNVTVLVIVAAEGDEPADRREAEIGPGDRSTGRRRGLAGYLERMSPRRPRAAGRRGSQEGSSPGAHAKGLSGRRRLLVIVVVVILVVGLGIGLLAAFNSSVYHVGIYAGRVALFQGMPHTVLGVQLYRLVEEGPVLYEQLDDYVKRRVDAKELTSKQEGQQFIRNLITEG